MRRNPVGWRGASVVAGGVIVLAELIVGLTRGPRPIILYAQTLPATVHAQWTPNPASEAVTSYTLTLDAGAPIPVLPTACSATLCSVLLSVPAFGAHVASVTASNLLISTDPTSLQTSPAATVNWILSAAPGRPIGATIKP